ncbi:MAG: nucleotidyltransferase domain-containing protein [Thiohalocapsa sp.]
MASHAATDPVLRRFRAALGQAYGDRIERVILYGSRARGNHQPDSDYDVAVFLRGPFDRWQEMEHIIPIVTVALYEDEACIHAMPFRADAYRDRTPLMAEIRREGIDL